MIPLVFGKTFSSDDHLRVLVQLVFIVVVAELRLRRSIAVDLSIIAHIILNHHHLVGSP